MFEIMITFWLKLEIYANYTLLAHLELKAQVSFSNHLLSIVRLSICKLITFSSSQEPLGQFQLKLSQNILK